jgi:hypothetical protein
MSKQRKVCLIPIGGLTIQTAPNGNNLLVSEPPQRSLSAREVEDLREAKPEILAWIDREAREWAIIPTPAAPGPNPEIGHVAFYCRGKHCTGWVMRDPTGRGTCDRCGLAQVFLAPNWVGGKLEGTEDHQ